MELAESGALPRTIWRVHRLEATVGAGENIVSDELPCEVEPQSLITVSFWFRDFTLLRSAVFTSGPLTEGYYAIGDMTET